MFLKILHFFSCTELPNKAYHTTLLIIKKQNMNCQEYLYSCEFSMDFESIPPTPTDRISHRM